MCGIAGYWNRNIREKGNEYVLKSMAQAIAHRGPDDEGYYLNNEGVALAHKRLSIIDLSPNGHQPMFSSDQRFILIYNGEIFNYLLLADELKKQGVKFRSNSDSEVIIEYYRIYGERCLEYFNGMFAFIIWDVEKQNMFAARDRIGIKPLYYYATNDIFVFGSEIKALLKHPLVPKQPNSEAINNYLVLSHQLDDQTWFKDVKLLEPGFFLQIDREKIVKKKYWNPCIEVNYTRTYSDVKEELRSKIIDAIKLHQISDVPVGSHLSGGVDSSTIVAIASRMGKGDFHTFSSSFSGLGGEFDENKEIDVVKEVFKTIHHTVTSDPQKVMESLPEMLYAMDEPVVGPAMLPMYFVNKLINQHGIRVVNGGQGVDELFGGYLPSYTLAAQNILSLIKSRKKVPINEVLNIASYLQKGGTFKRLFNRTKSDVISLYKDKNTYPDAISRYLNTADQIGIGELKFEKSMYMSLKHYLPGLLQQEDRMSMLWSIESRVPFLDHRLVELALTIPSYYKVKNGVLKSIFREAVRGLVPDIVLDNRIKRGYPTPISIWSKNEMAPFFVKTLKKDNSGVNDFIDMDSVQLMLNSHISGNGDYTTSLWSALCTKVWFSNNFN